MKKIVIDRNWVFKLFCCIALNLSAFTISAQTPTFAWATAGITGGTDGYSDQEYIVSDYNGNTYISGTFYNDSVTFGSHTLYNSSYNYWSLFVVKYDPNGQVLWAIQPTGLFYSNGMSLAIDPINGKLYITGRFAYEYNSVLNNGTYLPGYFGSYTFSQSTTNHQMMARLDAATGTVDWVKEFADAITLSAITVRNNSVYVGGLFTGEYYNYGTGMEVDTPVSFGNGIMVTNTSAYGNGSIFLAGFDSNGNTLWVSPSRVPCGSGASVTSVTTDNNGNPCMTGDITNCLVLGSDSIVNANHWMFTAKYNSSGNILWARTNGAEPVSEGAGYNSSTKIVCDGNNDVLITGVYFYTLTWGNDTITNNYNSPSENYHGFVVKYDPSGNVLWALDPGAEFNTSFGGPSIATDKSNNVYLTMTYEAPFTFGNDTLSPINGTSGEDRDIFVAKMDPNGNPLWLKSAGGTLDDYASDITTDTSGDVFITGSFASPDCRFDNTVLSSPGAGLSIFVAKIGPSTNADVVQFTGSDTAICQNSSITFTDQSTGSPTGWNWTFTGGTPSTSTQRNPTITYNSTGTFNVKLVATFSSGTDSLIKSGYITVIQRPVAGTIAATDDSICAGDTTQLSATGNSGGNIQWQSSLTSSGFTDIAGANTTGYTDPLNQTTYFRLIALNGGCADTSAAFMQVVNPTPAPPVLTTPDSIICSSDSTRINTSNSYTSYKWNDGDTRPYTYAYNAGGYWVTVSDANGCTAVSQHQIISVYPVPSVSIIEQGDTLSSFGYNSYQWYFNDSAIQGANAASYIATQTGNYAVQISDSDGCKALSTYTHIATGISEIINSSGLIVYPNPANTTLNIRYTSSTGQAYRYTLLNDLGEILMTGTLPYNETGTLDTHALPRGVYLLQLRTEEQTISKMVVVE